MSHRDDIRYCGDPPWIVVFAMVVVFGGAALALWAL